SPPSSTKRHEDAVDGTDRDATAAAAALKDDLLDRLDAGRVEHDEVCHPRVHLKHDASPIEPFAQRPRERIILIVDRAHDPLQAVETADHVSKANKIAVELDRAVPGLESKGRAPHQPEVGP